MEIPVRLRVLILLLEGAIWPLVIFFPTPSPQAGTLQLSIAPALSAAVATHADSAGTSSTAASFDAAVRGSEAAAREKSPAPRPKGGTLNFSIAPAFPAAVATGDDSAGKIRAGANFNTSVRRGDAFTKVGAAVPATHQNQPHLQLVHVQTGTTAFLSCHLLGSMLVPQALVALAECRAMS